MQQTSDVNNDAEALCCFRLVQSVRVQNVTYRRKCHPTHWFRCEHYSEQPCTFVHTSTPWKTDWLGSQAVVTITLTVGIRTWVYQRSVLLPGLTSAVIYSETHKLVLSLKVYGIRCLLIIKGLSFWVGWFRNEINQAVCEVITKLFYYFKGICMPLCMEYNIVQMSIAASHDGIYSSGPIFNDSAA